MYCFRSSVRNSSGPPGSDRAKHWRGRVAFEEAAPSFCSGGFLAERFFTAVFLVTERLDFFGLVRFSAAKASRPSIARLIIIRPTSRMIEQGLKNIRICFLPKVNAFSPNLTFQIRGSPLQKSYFIWNCAEPMTFLLEVSTTSTFHAPVCPGKIFLLVQVRHFAAFTGTLNSWTFFPAKYQTCAI